MSAPGSFVPALRSDVVRVDVGHESVVWSPIRTAPVALDAVESLMLSVVDGEASVAQLVEDVVDAVGLARPAAVAQVNRVLATFDAAGLLTTSAAITAGADPDPDPEVFANPPSP